MSLNLLALAEDLIHSTLIYLHKDFYMFPYFISQDMAILMFYLVDLGKIRTLTRRPGDFHLEMKVWRVNSCAMFEFCSSLELLQLFPVLSLFPSYPPPILSKAQKNMKDEQLRWWEPCNVCPTVISSTWPSQQDELFFFFLIQFTFVSNNAGRFGIRSQSPPPELCHHPLLSPSINPSTERPLLLATLARH